MNLTRDTLTISTSERTYTVQGNSNDINELFQRLVQETMKPVATSTPVAVPTEDPKSFPASPLVDTTEVPVNPKRNTKKDPVAVETHSDSGETEAPKEEDASGEATSEEVSETVTLKPEDYVSNRIIGVDTMSFEFLQEIKDAIDKPENEDNKVVKYNVALINTAFNKRDIAAAKLKGETIDDETKENKKRYQPKDKDGNDIENPTYKGFLIVKCATCGNIKSFNARTPLHDFKCDCGAITPLDDMVPVTAICECGERWRYYTNMVDSAFDISCLHCGSPIPLFYNEKAVKYETLLDDSNRKKGSKKSKKSKK